MPRSSGWFLIPPVTQLRLQSRPPPGAQGPTGGESPPRDPAGRIGPQDGRTDTWFINNPIVIVGKSPKFKDRVVRDHFQMAVFNGLINGGDTNHILYGMILQEAPGLHENKHTQGIVGRMYPDPNVPRHGKSRNISPIARGYLWVSYPQESQLSLAIHPRSLTVRPWKENAWKTTFILGPIVYFQGQTVNNFQGVYPQKIT